ncbi:MAG TPA: RNA polymerase sigma factor [Ktedonobacterales bacterium]
MDPHVRPYHPNSAGDARPRGQRPAKRQTPKPAPPAAVAKPAKPRARRGNATATAKPRGKQSRASTLAEPIASVQVSEANSTPEEAVVEVAQADASDVEAADTTNVGVDAREAIDGAGAESGAGSVVGIGDFEDIFIRFQTPITNFVYRLVGNREQAFDLAQDVFVKAYRALAGGATIQAGALSSWLYRIASNTATDALRRRRLISWLPLSLFNDDRGVGAGMPGSDSGFGMPVPTDEHMVSAVGAFTANYDGGRFEQRVADREIVERVLRRLPEKYAACLLLYEHEGFSCAEIAEVLSVTPSAVKMRLMRARERFIALYQQELEGRR